MPPDVAEPWNHDFSHHAHGHDYRMAFLAGASLDFGLDLRLKADDQNAGAICRLMCFILSALGDRLGVQHILHPQRHEPIPGTVHGAATLPAALANAHKRPRDHTSSHQAASQEPGLQSSASDITSPGVLPASSALWSRFCLSRASYPCASWLTPPFLLSHLVPGCPTPHAIKYKDEADIVVGCLIYLDLPYCKGRDTLAIWEGVTLTYDSHVRRATLHFKLQGDSSMSTMTYEKCAENVTALMGAAAPESEQERLSNLVNVRSLCEAVPFARFSHPFGEATGDDMPTGPENFSVSIGDIPPLQMEIFEGQGENGLFVCRSVPVCACMSSSSSPTSSPASALSASDLPRSLFFCLAFFPRVFSFVCLCCVTFPRVSPPLSPCLRLFLISFLFLFLPPFPYLSLLLSLCLPLLSSLLLSHSRFLPSSLSSSLSSLFSSSLTASLSSPLSSPQSSWFSFCLPSSLVPFLSSSLPSSVSSPLSSSSSLSHPFSLPPALLLPLLLSLVVSLSRPHSLPPSLPPSPPLSLFLSSPRSLPVSPPTLSPLLAPFLPSVTMSFSVSDATVCLCACVCVAERPKVQWAFDQTRLGAYVFVKPSSSLSSAGAPVRRVAFVV